ncbi:MAG: hypothetical protein ACXW11_11485 [Methylotenera sp.]
MDNFGAHDSLHKEQIYAVYLSIFNLISSTQKKCSILTPLLGGYETSWRVIGITKAALELLAENEYRYVKGAICRAHIVGRYETAKQIFECNAPLDLSTFFEIVWKNDRTVIATKSENKNNGTLPKVIPIDYLKKLFTCNEIVGFKFRKIEAEFLKDLHLAFNSGKLDLTCPYMDTKKQ